MARYRVTRRYESGLGSYAEGDVVDLVDDFAAHINRDSPGTLELEPAYEALPPAERAFDAPPQDRMVKSARKRQDRQGDPGDQGAMSRADFKATRSG